MKNKAICKYCGMPLKNKYYERDGMCPTCKAKLPVVKELMKVCAVIKTATTQKRV